MFPKSANFVLASQCKYFETKVVVTDVVLLPVPGPSFILFRALLRASVSVFLLGKGFVSDVTVLTVPDGRVRQTDLVSALRGGVSVGAESGFVVLIILVR